MVSDVANLLTPEQAADRLAGHGMSVTSRTLRRWVVAGSLPAVVLPSGRYLLSEDDVDGLVATEGVAS